MTIKQALEKGTIMLKGENLDSPKIKARLLMQDILNKPRTYLLVHDNQIINEKILEKYFKNIEKVKNGIPIEHITHQKEFMKLSFYVNENVLIPRQDTEVLVEEVISIAKRINAKKILDLCTGSGSIAVSLAKYIENSQITAVDISKEALMVAKKNAKNNNVENNITSYRGEYVASTRTYSFGNIAKLLKTHIENSPDEDLVINVIPVQRRVGTTYNYYNQPQDYTVAIENYLKPSGVKLRIDKDAMEMRIVTIEYR